MALRRDLATARRGAIVSCVGGLRELGREDVGRQDLGCCAEEVLVGHQGCDDGAVGVGVASGLVGECIEDPEGVGVGPDREPDNRSYFFVGERDTAPASRSASASCCPSAATILATKAYGSDAGVDMRFSRCRGFLVKRVQRMTNKGM